MTLFPCHVASVCGGLALGATLGATETDDRGSRWTDANGGSVIDLYGERIRTSLKIAWGPCKQKVRGSILLVGFAT